jgi:hypothetical protein
VSALVKQLASDRERVAHHEAGHAVIGILLKQRFRYVSIKTEETVDYVRFGHVEPVRRKRRPDYNRGGLERTAERSVMVCFAGLEAERIFTGRELRSGAVKDQESAVSHARARLMHGAPFSGTDEKEVALYLEWLRYRTRKMLSAPSVWRAVGALAHELLAQQTIKYRDASAIVYNALAATP